MPDGNVTRLWLRLFFAANSDPVIMKRGNAFQTDRWHMTLDAIGGTLRTRLHRLGLMAVHAMPFIPSGIFRNCSMRIVTCCAPHDPIRFLKAQTLHQSGWLESRQNFGLSHQFGLFDRFRKSMTTTTGLHFGHRIRPLLRSRILRIFIA